MKPTAFYFFTHIDERGKRVKSTYRMTLEVAQQRLKAPEVVEWSKEIRMCPEDFDEHQHTSVLSDPGPRPAPPQTTPPPAP